MQVSSRQNDVTNAEWRCLAMGDHGVKQEALLLQRDSALVSQLHNIPFE